MNHDMRIELAIDRDGIWRYRGMEMSRQDIVALFYRRLRRDEAGYWIEAGGRRIPVDVVDTAYVVQAVRYSPSQDAIYLFISDGSVEMLNPLTLRIGNSNVPYCSIKNNAFEARFATPGYYQLAEHIGHDSHRDRYYIRIGGRMYHIPEAGRS